MSSPQEGTEQVEDAFPVAVPLNDPPERTPTTLSHKAFRQLCIQFGIAEADALLPEINDTADMPPHGFVAVNRQMCSSGAIPHSMTVFENFFSDYLFPLFNYTPTATPSCWDCVCLSLIHI